MSTLFFFRARTISAPQASSPILETSPLFNPSLENATAAFAALPAGTVDGLLKPESKAALTNVLIYHVVAGAVKAADLTDGQKVKTLQGEELTVSIKDGKVMINGANVTAADLTGSNGVVHVIDAVLMPKK